MSTIRLPRQAPPDDAIAFAHQWLLDIAAVLRRACAAGAPALRRSVGRPTALDLWVDPSLAARAARADCFDFVEATRSMM